MEEVKAINQHQGSVCSDSNSENTIRIDGLSNKIYLVGSIANDSEIYAAAQSFGFPVLTCIDEQDCVENECSSTVFVVEDFDGDIFNKLYRSKLQLLGPIALKQLALKKEKLPCNTRPLYNLAMTGVIVCFTGFREKGELAKLVSLIHHMGGSIRKDMSSKVTHLIANTAGGEKYQYASTFRVPIMNPTWVIDSWEHRQDLNFTVTLEEFVAKHRLKPFHGAKVSFIGFTQEEEKHMCEVLVLNGGTVTHISDPACTHVVVDECTVTERPETSSKVWIVKAEWFWTSVQKETSLVERDYLFDDYLDQVLSPSGRRESNVTPGGSARRRKRKLLLSSLVHPQSPAVTKRRSSVSDAGLLSVSGSFLDCTASPAKEILDGVEPVIDTPRKGFTQRHRVFLELVQTETNYVDILHTIMTMFKKHLEEMPEEEALLNNTELNLIFGKIPLIYESHVKMLDELRWTAAHWSEDQSIGSIIVKYSNSLQKAYPPFINYFEEMKEVLCQCDQNKPRFHAFLKACQTRSECGRQSLQELMIRPVQRLGSISLLLNDILKNTAKSNPDHSALEQALAALREVMTHINEDKRKAEGQVTLFNIFNDIDNCPPDIVSSHRNFIARAEVIQLSSSEGLASKGNYLVLFLFSDQLEVCKKKSKSFNSLKSPSSVAAGGVGASLQNRQLVKPYKHVRLLALNTIKRVIDIKETEDCQKVFSLVCRNNDDLKEKLYSFSMADEEADKVSFLKTLTRQMANNACTADADKFMAYLEPQQLDIETSDVSNGTFSKAFKFATNRFKVGRAFSFNKTPSKLKRAVSSMMSPFGSSTNLTPASQLAQMKLASYSNINELGSADKCNDSQPVAPMSVQPTRKMKTSSLGPNALKRL